MNLTTCLCYLLVHVMSFCGSAVSLQDMASDDMAGPAKVFVGVYLNQIHEVNLKENRFTADFWIWFRWTDTDLKPIETFELTNGQIESKEGVTQWEKEGLNYAACRVVASVTKFWDTSDFPLDNHRLSLEVEDGENEMHKLVYVADSANCGFDPSVQIPGWKPCNALNQIDVHKYKTNYGDITLPTSKESAYSRFQFSVDAMRPGFGYFAKLFSGLFVSTLVAFLAFLMKPDLEEARFGLGVGSLFAAVASQYVVSSALPDTQLVTLVDKLHVAALIFIMLSMFESTLSVWLASSDKEKLAVLLDRWSFIIFLSFFVILTIVIVLGRSAQPV